MITMLSHAHTLVAFHADHERRLRLELGAEEHRRPSLQVHGACECGASHIDASSHSRCEPQPARPSRRWCGVSAPEATHGRDHAGAARTLEYARGCDQAIEATGRSAGSVHAVDGLIRAMQSPRSNAALRSDGFVTSTADRETLSETPFVSVILPVRNEARYIEACIERLIDQDYPSARMEILVVDGRSSDDTRAKLRLLQQRHPHVALTVLDNPAKGIAPALNIAVRAARGEVIVRMDGHSVPAKDYVSACIAALRRSGATSVGGIVEAVGSTPFGAAVALVTTHRLGAGDAKYRVGSEPGFVDTVPFGAFRRDIFDRIGPFDESMARNEDYEFNVRIRAAGERIYLDPAIAFTYTPRGTVRGLWSQYFQYGWWRVETFRRHPRSMRMRQIIPPAFVATLLALTLAAPMTRLAAHGLGLLAFAYVVVVFATAWRLAGSRRASALHVALAFAIVHVAWGLGFLTNLVTVGRFPYGSRSQPDTPSRRHARGDTRPGTGQ